MAKQNPEFEIEVGGAPYVWRIQRRPQWSSDTAAWRGMAIAVRHQEGQSRRTFIDGQRRTAAQWVASAELMCPRPWARAEPWSLRSLLRGPRAP